MDRNYGEVSLATCRRCGQIWLCYFYEIEAFSGSGRWYRGPVGPETAADMTPDDAIPTLEAMDWLLYGGSFYDTAGAFTTRTKITLFP